MQDDDAPRPHFFHASRKLPDMPYIDDFADYFYLLLQNYRSPSAALLSSHSSPSGLMMMPQRSDCHDDEACFALPEGRWSRARAAEHAGLRTYTRARPPPFFCAYDTRACRAFCAPHRYILRALLMRAFRAFLLPFSFLADDDWAERARAIINTLYRAAFRFRGAAYEKDIPDDYTCTHYLTFRSRARISAAILSARGPHASSPRCSHARLIFLAARLYMPPRFQHFCSLLILSRCRAPMRAAKMPRFRPSMVTGPYRRLLLSLDAVVSIVSCEGRASITKRHDTRGGRYILTAGDWMAIGQPAISARISVMMHKNRGYRAFSFREITLLLDARYAGQRAG